MKLLINDAVAYIPSGEEFYLTCRVIAVDAEGYPLLKEMDYKNQVHWLNGRPTTKQNTKPYKVTKIGRYERVLGFLWWRFIPLD